MALFSTRQDANDPGKMIRDAWTRLSRMPGGKWAFSRMIGTAAPYTGSMGARVNDLQDGHAEVELRDRRRVRNHLRCIHAVALANLAELTGSLAVGFGLPPGMRFIPIGLSIEYVKKARGTITATSDCVIEATNSEYELEAPISLKNPEGEEVAVAKLRIKVGPVRSSTVPAAGPS